MSKTTEMSILDTFYSVHTGDQTVVPHGCSMHVDGQDPRLMARESKANHKSCSFIHCFPLWQCFLMRELKT